MLTAKRLPQIPGHIHFLFPRPNPCFLIFPKRKQKKEKGKPIKCCWYKKGLPPQGKPYIRMPRLPERQQKQALPAGSLPCCIKLSSPFLTSFRSCLYPAITALIFRLLFFFMPDHFPDHILGRSVHGNIHSSDVLSYKPHHQHQHASHKTSTDIRALKPVTNPGGLKKIFLIMV